MAELKRRVIEGTYGTGQSNARREELRQGPGERHLWHRAMTPQQIAGILAKWRPAHGR